MGDQGPGVDVCSRCGGPNEVETRGEKFCNDCYLKFISIKFRKTMDRYRVNYLIPEIPKLLVPVSFGPGSLALADMVNDLLVHQKEKYGGRVGFEVICAYIGDDEPRWPFPELDLLRISQSRAFKGLARIDGMEYSENSLDGLSRTSRQDLVRCLQKQVIADLADKLEVDGVLLGFSMTSIAELVITETVKGRGASLACTVNPPTNILYPLREILAPEVDKYLTIRGLSCHVAAVSAVPGITKLQSIDELVHNYFASVQREFPAVVSTVAKTAAKLANSPDECYICMNGEGICYACQVMLLGRGGPKSLERNPHNDVLDDYLL